MDAGGVGDGAGEGEGEGEGEDEGGGTGDGEGEGEGEVTGEGAGEGTGEGEGEGAGDNEGVGEPGSVVVVLLSPAAASHPPARTSHGHCHINSDKVAEHINRKAAAKTQLLIWCQMKERGKCSNSAA